MQILGAVTQIEVEDILVFITVAGAFVGGIIWVVNLFLGFSKRFDKINNDRDRLKAHWGLTLQALTDELRWLDARIKHLEQFETQHGFQPRSRPPSPKTGIQFYNENTDEDETQIPRL